MRPRKTSGLYGHVIYDLNLLKVSHNNANFMATDILVLKI